VSTEMLHFKNKMTPYAGHTLRGVVHQTWLRGKKIWDNEDGGHQGPPRGIMLLEERQW
jgi:allantoinase